MSEQKDFEPMMTQEEILVMKRITTADAPHSQRAQALLALAAGKTQEEAAEASGLRPTQVKYWDARYRKAGLAAFPDDLIVEETQPEEAIEMVEVVEIESVVEETAVSPKTPASIIKKDKEKTKKKKSKETKGKKVKKEKKPKKEKKANKKKKKGKKSKKDKKKTGNNKKKKKAKKEKSNKKEIAYPFSDE